MDHSTHTLLSLAEQTEATLIGATIYGANDEKVGTISHLHRGVASPKVVVDVGGFLGIGSKPVLVNLEELNMMRDDDGTVHGKSSWTKDQLLSLPEHRD
jgi:hypothetical protein